MFVEVSLDANDDTVTSSTSQATPVAASYLSQISAIGRTREVNADDPRPGRRAVLRGRTRGRLFPKSQIVCSDAAKEHEDAGDDVGRGRDTTTRRAAESSMF